MSRYVKHTAALCAVCAAPAGAEAAWAVTRGTPPFRGCVPGGLCQGHTSTCCWDWALGGGCRGKQQQEAHPLSAAAHACNPCPVPLSQSTTRCCHATASHQNHGSCQPMTGTGSCHATEPLTPPSNRHQQATIKPPPTKECDVVPLPMRMHTSNLAATQVSGCTAYVLSTQAPPPFH
jgi:hypothetical protein